MRSRSDLAVPEETVLKACGETSLPEVGVIEQVWDTDPIPEDELGRRAGAAVGDLKLEEIPEGGEVAVGVGSRGIANLPIIRVDYLTDIAEMSEFTSKLQAALQESLRA